jgi:hypothetical protein
MTDTTVTSEHYIINGIKHIRVSLLIKHVFKSKSTKEILQSMSKKTREEKYKGLSDEEIIQMWEENGEDARNEGTAMHNNIECYLFGVDSAVENKLFNEKILPLLQSELTIFEVEQTLHCHHRNNKNGNEFRFAGTFDVMFRNKHPEQPKRLILGDWKYSKKIHTVNNPFPSPKDSIARAQGWKNGKYYEYTLQLNIYAYMFELQFPELTIDELWLICLHPLHEDDVIMVVPKFSKDRMIEIFDAIADSL